MCFHERSNSPQEGVCVGFRVVVPHLVLIVYVFTLNSGMFSRAPSCEAATDLGQFWCSLFDVLGEAAYVSMCFSSTAGSGVFAALL